MVKYLDSGKSSGFSQWMANQNKQTTEKKGSKLSGFLWWLAIFALAWWGFSVWFGPKKDVTPTTEIITTENIANVPAVGVDGEKLSAQVQGLRISKIELKDYKQDRKENKDKNITLLGGNDEYAEFGFTATGTDVPVINTRWKSVNASEMTWTSSTGVQFKRNIVLDSGSQNVIGVTDSVLNKSSKPISVATYSRIARASDTKSNAGVSTGGIAFADDSIENEGWKSIGKKQYLYQSNERNPGFVGFTDQYWETVLHNQKAGEQTLRLKQLADGRYQADTAIDAVQIMPGQSHSFSSVMYAGPKNPADLKIASESIPGINRTIDYGWFWFLAQPMLWALNALNALVMNYGLAIILLTIGLRLLMWPLTRKSYTSMAAMQKMQPEMAKIQKLYANDKARQQMELMKLYQSHKTSPMSGCLPMLLQIPIFFALYKALLVSVQMRCAGFLWLSDLSVMDPYFILPLLMGATMWWQQKLQTGTTTPNANDPMAQTQKIMKWMPILFTVMFAWMPAGLLLYWTVSNLFGIGQMYVIKKTMK